MIFADKKAVIFDLDGTLLDTLDDLKNSLNAALTDIGFPERTRSEVRRFVGNGLAKLAERAVPDGTAPEQCAKVLALTRRYYAEKCRECTKPYEGIGKLLTDLHGKGLLLGVLSNKPDAQVKTLCRDFFGDLIRLPAGQREGIPLKPAPDALLSAITALGCTPEETVYAGDSDVDILTAKNAGIPCISVLWGFRDRDFLLKSGAKILVSSPEEMAQLF
ncbi:MAG: HAD family hydrolase [Oscillospiraceae bacterium]|nr:HAD family hydrolase [Oscillospiraceae bacterium]